LHVYLGIVIGKIFSVAQLETSPQTPRYHPAKMFGGPSNTSVLNCHDVWGLEGGP